MKTKHPIRYIMDNVFKGFYLEKYVLKDGKTHPVAIICPVVTMGEKAHEGSRNYLLGDEQLYAGQSFRRKGS